LAPLLLEAKWRIAAWVGLYNPGKHIAAVARACHNSKVIRSKPLPKGQNVYLLFFGVIVSYFKNVKQHLIGGVFL
jgi:hypothetical protein